MPVIIYIHHYYNYSLLTYFQPNQIQTSELYYIIYINMKKQTYTYNSNL